MRIRLAVASLFVLSCAPVCGKEPPREIGVVKTVRDLKAQPVIELGEGVRIRLGIEARSCPVGGGVMLYCLTEGYQPEARWEGDDRFGPVRAVVTTPGLKVLHEISRHARDQRDGEIDGSLLFLEAVLMASDKRREVRVLTREGGVLAATEVKAAGDPFHPWFTLKSGKAIQHVEELREKGEPADLRIAYLTNRSSGWALPAVDAMHPILFEGKMAERTVERIEGERLPTLVPREPTPGFKLRIAPPTKAYPVALRINSEKKFNQSRPDWHFLVRWWVNGKPFRGEQEIRNFGDDNGHMSIGKNLELRLEFDPKSIGAKSRDRVAVQLLYSPGGWNFVADDLMQQLMHMTGEDEKVMLTNPVEWVED